MAHDNNTVGITKIMEERLLVWNNIPDQSLSTETQIKLIINNEEVLISNYTICYDIVKNYEFKNKSEILALWFNGTIVDLTGKLCNYICDTTMSYEIEPIYFTQPQGQHIFWHSSAHILGYALESLYEASLLTGPPVNEGFYYDAMIADNKIIDPKLVEEAMNKIIIAGYEFERKVITIDQARELFKSNTHKLEILDNIEESTLITAYKCGNFIDLCRGPHLKNTKLVSSIVILNVTNTCENNIKRVRAISFPTSKEMKNFQHEQKRRSNYSHQIIGAKQKLFFFHEHSPGSCFFLPHGTRMINALTKVMREFYYSKGFQEVITPNIFKAELYKTSGHYENYKDNMFGLNCENEEYFLKPMNCPGHCLMFAHESRSYNDLPIRYADFGALHRNELSNTLVGLSRNLRFHQDDSHIFCAKKQIKTEIINAIHFVREVYNLFGFKFSVELSTRPTKFEGEIELWNYAENILREILTEEFGNSWKINKKDGAFYGPKVDFKISDNVNRIHQTATIQLDFVQPEKFKLEYMDENNKMVRPVIIHRAIYGSLERFYALLIEHYEGIYPLWLSPRQIVIVPIDNKYEAYCKEIYEMFRTLEMFVSMDLSSNTFSKKIAKFSALNEKHNYILIVGEKEVKDRLISVKDSKDQKYTIDLDEFYCKIVEELEERK